MKTNFKALLFFILLNSCFASCYAQTVIVVDAGSSGTRFWVYNYSPAKGNSLNTTITYVTDVEYSPGISALAVSNNNQLLDVYLKRYLDFLKQHLSPEQSKGVPIYWFSTAGMRLVSPVYQQKTYAYVKKYIEKNSPFVIADMRTIPGWEEGALMWLTANYPQLQDNSKNTLGIIDMGGASMQIAFQAKTPLKQAPNVNIILQGQQYSIYSYSFLGLGVNSFRAQFSDEPTCFYNQYSLPEGGFGTGKLADCSQTIMPYLHRVQDFVNQVEVPANAIPFMGIDNLYESIAKTYVASNGKSFDLIALDNAGQKFCAKNWNDLKTSPDANAFEYCFNLSYIKQLLTTLNFARDTDIAVADPSWTMGQAILLANQGRLELKK